MRKHIDKEKTESPVLLHLCMAIKSFLFKVIIGVYDFCGLWSITHKR